MKTFSSKQHPQGLGQTLVGCYERKRYSIQGPYEFGKVMEIENAIFQGPESVGKERIFNMAMEKFWIFCLEQLKKYPKTDVAQFCIKHHICYVCSFYYL